MALSIKDPETERLARALAEATGESLTEAIRIALAERLARESRRSQRRLSVEIRRIQERLAALPVLDPRRGEDIIGYDDDGLPV
jgi:antitoxin VapB